MAEPRRRWIPAAVMVVLATVIAVGLLSAPPREPDRTAALAQQLRCPVCQGESVAASPSETATAMRDQIEQMVAAGRSDAEILDHYVARYGRWILLDPAPRGDTLLLWLLPVGALIAGAAVVATRRRRRAPIRPLTEDERAALQRHLSSPALQEDIG